MRSILFISLMNSVPWGGSEEQWSRVALWMVRNGYHVDVCCYDWGNETAQRLQALRDAGCSIFFMPNRKETKNIFGKLQWKKRLRDVPFENYDFVYVNQGGWKEAVHGPFKQLHKRLKYFALSYHNYQSKVKYPAHKLELLQTWINKAGVNIAMADKIFKVLKNEFGLNIPNQYVGYNPITFEPPAAASPYPPLENGNFEWVMLAELDTERKAQDVLIKTLSSEKWKQRNWILKFYGKGKDENMLQNLIGSLGLQQKIFLCGHTSHVQQALEECHLLFQCTHIDAMPISVVEAMSMARPCFVSDVGDMPVWVSHEKNGFVCEKADEEMMDNCLEQCWQQKHRWEEMGREAFQTFIQKYPQPYEEKFVTVLEHYYQQKKHDGELSQNREVPTRVG